MAKNRDPSIDLLRFLAVVLVVNSHLDHGYPDAYKALATGGALGDALFFFVSGFTLFIGRDGGFVTWYKRRLSRIMPAVIVCVLAYAILYGPGWYGAVGGYWFIRCILIYYLILFFVRRFMLKCLWLPLALALAVTVAWWIAFEDPEHNIYGGGCFKWCHYVIPMLTGAIVGLNRGRFAPRAFLDGLCLAVCIAGYYGLEFLALRTAGCEWMQLLTIPFLSGAMVCLYKLANSRIALAFRVCRAGAVAVAVGGLCLEVYLSHRVFVTDRFNGLFPLNIAGIFAASVLLAYVVSVASRFLSQTLDGRDGYDFRAMLRLRGA